jgi:hypothetical protein
MAAGFEVDPQTVRGAAHGLGQVARRFWGELDEVQARLAGYGSPWGNDDIGALIGETYLEVSEFAFDRFQSILDDLQYFADGLDRMAANYDSVESGNTAAFNRLGDEVEG